MNSFDGTSLVQLTLTRIREWVRQPEAVFWTFFFPVLIALALGFAFQQRGPEPVRVAVERDAALREAYVALEASDRVRPAWMPARAAREALGAGEVALLVEADGRGVAYRYDPGREESRLARLEVDNVLQRAAGREDARATQDRVVTAPGSRYIDFLIAGLIGFNLLSSGLWGAGYTVVRMRSGRLLKRFMATPMRRGEFLLSFVLARLVFLGPEVGLLLGFAWLVFDVTVHGSLWALAAIVVLGAVTFTAFGLLVASRARTTEGVSGLMNLAAMPMWVLSGVFFSSEYFPDAMQPFIDALPLTAFVDALRAVMNDGAALVATTGSLAVLVAWAVGSVGAALAIFRWR